jgi:polysaccharide export outer membrane protein
VIAGSTGAQVEAASSSYVLGPEDVVTITVLRHPDYSGDFLIPPSGVLEVPAIGPVIATNKSLGQLTRELTTIFGEKRLKHPDVSVSLKVARLQRIYVVGDVRESGVYDLKPGWGVSQGLAAAGGLDLAVARDDVKVTLKHTDGSPDTVANLNEVLKKPDDPTYMLHSGDTLRFEAKELIPVYVSGRVKSPGLYSLRVDSSDVLAAIAQAGGFLDDSSYTVTIQHLNGTRETVDLSAYLVRSTDSAGSSAILPTGQVVGKLALPKVVSGDMIVVQQSTNSFSVLGYVSKPGFYPIPDGRIFRLTDAIAVASGEGATHGRITHVELLRKENGESVRTVYNLDKFIKKGDTTQNPEVRAGDTIYVPQTNHLADNVLIGGLSVAAILYSALKR